MASTPTAAASGCSSAGWAEVPTSLEGRSSLAAAQVRAAEAEALAALATLVAHDASLEEDGPQRKQDKKMSPEPSEPLPESQRMNPNALRWLIAEKEALLRKLVRRPPHTVVQPPIGSRQLLNPGPVSQGTPKRRPSSQMLGSPCKEPRPPQGERTSLLSRREVELRKQIGEIQQQLTKLVQTEPHSSSDMTTAKTQEVSPSVRTAPLEGDRSFGSSYGDDVNILLPQLSESTAGFIPDRDLGPPSPTWSPSSPQTVFPGKRLPHGVWPQ